MSINLKDFADLGAIISANKEKLQEVTSQTNSGSGFAPLPDGYYYCKLETIELTRTKDKGDGVTKPMFKAQFRVIQDGVHEVKENGKNVLKNIDHTTNRIIFKYWVIKTELEDPDCKSYSDFKSDILKILEHSINDESVMDNLSDALNDLETMVEVLDAISNQDYPIYINQTSRPKKDDPTDITTFTTLMGWDRVEDLGLPTE